MLEAIDSLVESIRSSGLLSPAQLKECASDLAARCGDAKSLAGELLRRGWLTAFQVNQLARGRGRELLVGPYVLLERLGQGGMGQVFKARHPLMNRVVALKVIRQDRQESAEAIQRFQREIRALASLSHPNIVMAHDAAQIDDRLFFVMEFIEGIDLAKLLGQKGQLPIAQACDYARQAALGLQHAHEQGLVHRDIKPGNLLLDAKSNVIKVLDLGLARHQWLDEGALSSEPLTDDYAVMGTADYMAPEQAQNSRAIDIRADIYSLGCTLYHLLTGKPPFPGGNMLQKLRKHLESEPVPVEVLRPDAPRQLVQLLRKAMAKRPADRFQTPGELALALEPFTRTVPGLRAAVPAASGDPLNPEMLLDTNPPLESTQDFKMRGQATMAAGMPPFSVSAPIATIIPPDSIRIARPAPVPPAEPAGGAADAATWFRWRTLVTSAVLLALLLPGSVWLAGIVLRVPADRGELLVKTVDPNVEVSIKKGGKVVEVLDLRTKQKLELPVGAYVAELTRGPKGLQLTADHFKITQGQRTLVELRWQAAAAVPKGERAMPKPALVDYPVLGTWKPGPVEESLYGLIPRPAHWSGIKRWQTNTVAPRGPVFSLAWSPDSQYLAQGGLDGAVRIFKKTPAGLELFRLFPGHADAVWSLAWNRDGTRLASVGWVNCIMRIWDVASGRQVAVSEARFGRAKIAWSPDGRWIAGPGDGNKLLLWDVKQNQMRSIPNELPGWSVVSLAWNPDGSLLASGHSDGSVLLWPAPLGEKPMVIGTHERSIKGPNRVSDLAWSPKGDLLASCGSDKTARLWDRSGKPKGILRYTDPLVSLAWSRDNRRLVLAADTSAGNGGAILLWEIDKGEAGQPKIIAHHEDPHISTLAWSPDDKWLASGTFFWGSHAVRLWNGANFTPGIVLEAPTPPHNPLPLPFSPDGKYLAALCLHGPRADWQILSLRDGRPTRRITGTYWSSWSSSWDRNNRLSVVLNAKQNRILTWKAGAANLEEITMPMSLHHLAWNPTGDNLLLVDSKHHLQLWDPVRGLGPILVGSTGFVDSVVWSPDGKKFATGGRDNTIRIWTPANGSSEPIFPGKGNAVLSWSPDNHWLACGCVDGVVRLWDVAQAKPGRIFRIKGERLYYTWSHDGRYFVSLSFSPAKSPDRELRFPHGPQVIEVWDTQTGLQVSGKQNLRLVGGDGWSPDGQLFAHAEVGVVRVWHIATGMPHLLAVFLPGEGQPAVFNAAGELLNPNAEVKRHLIYVIEKNDGAFELLTADQFLRRVQEAGKRAVDASAKDR